MGFDVTGAAWSDPVAECNAIMEEKGGVMESIVLLGAEDVARAGRQIHSAAETIQHAINGFYGASADIVRAAEAIEGAAHMMNEIMGRLEFAIGRVEGYSHLFGVTSNGNKGVK